MMPISILLLSILLFAFSIPFQQLEKEATFALRSAPSGWRRIPLIWGLSWGVGSLLFLLAVACFLFSLIRMTPPLLTIFLLSITLPLAALLSVKFIFSQVVKSQREELNQLFPFLIRFFALFRPLEQPLIHLCNSLMSSTGENEGLFRLIHLQGKLKAMAELEAHPQRLRAMEKEMLVRLMNFGETTAREVMVPLVNVVAVAQETSVRELLRVFQDCGFSQLPVYDDHVSNIVGIVGVFDALGAALEPEKIVRSLMRIPKYIPESRPIESLLVSMQQKATKIAIVVDEFGAAIGIVTIEDILEEVVGDIADEYEESPQWFREIRKGSYLVSARATLSRINEELPFSIPEGDFETLAGFLLQQFKKIPAVGDKIEIGGVSYSIQKGTDRSIDLVKITQL